MGIKNTICILALAVIAASTSACATHRFAYTSNLQPSGQKVEESGSYFLWGLVGEKKLAGASACPGGVASVQTQHSFVDQLLATFTVGIYTPMTITVECAGGQRSADAKQGTASSQG
ncbi:MAG: Bor family protein [Deltaproteobacteria bacterium]|nr:Bor family protein [Deltaproteobacteria bacterium]